MVLDAVGCLQRRITSAASEYCCVWCITKLQCATTKHQDSISKRARRERNAHQTSLDTFIRPQDRGWQPTSASLSTVNARVCVTEEQIHRSDDDHRFQTLALRPLRLHLRFNDHFVIFSVHCTSVTCCYPDKHLGSSFKLRKT